VPADLLKAFPGLDVKLMADQIVNDPGLERLLKEMKSQKATNEELSVVIKEAIRHRTELSDKAKGTLLTVIESDKIQEAASSVVEFLKDGDSHVQYRANGILFSLGNKKVAKDIVELLKSDNPGVREMAVYALGNLRVKESAGDIAKLLKDGNPRVRWMTARVLGWVEAKEYIKDVAELLKDDAPEARDGALEGLGELGAAKEYAKEIGGLLRDESAQVRGSAAWELGKHGIREYAKDIAVLLKDVSPRCREQAMWALDQFGAKECANDIAQVLTDADLGNANQEMKTSVIDILCRFHAKQCAKDIANLLRNEKDGYVRERAVRALGTLGAKEYARDISTLLTDNDSDIRSAAAGVLGRLGAKEYAKEIAELLKYEKETVRSWAADALGNLGAKEYGDAIAELLADGDPSCVGYASLALAKLGEPAARFMDKLIEAMPHIQALWGTGLSNAVSALNRARSPELCATLAAKKLPEYEFSGSWREILADIGKRAGFEVDMSGAASPEVLDRKDTLSVQYEVSVLGLLEEMQAKSLILVFVEGSAGKGKLRIVSSMQEILKCSQDWWAEQEQKK
jgi:HEAT repeat protein